MKRFQRLAQRGAEAFGRGEKTDKLTSKLAEIERRVEGIRSGCQVIIKRLSSTFVGSGSTLEKHQKRIPQYTLGTAMMESGNPLNQSPSLFGTVLVMVGQTQIDIAAQMSQYEISVTHDIIQDLNTMLEEDFKKVEKAKKKLSNARLDMDAARTRLRSYEAHVEKATREYNIEKLNNMRQEVDECTKTFDDAQDHYATEMYDFLSKEQVYTRKILELVKLQITLYNTAGKQLEGMMPTFEKKISASQQRPVFGVSLTDHLSNVKQEIATVIDICCASLRETAMDTEGLFRIAAGQAKVKFLKSAFDAGQTDVSAHDPHAIAGCLKMYLRELPEPLLTYPLYSDWIKAAGIGDQQERLQALREVKEQLPAPNLKNLQHLMGFLHEFSLYSEITKMTVNNIAIVIGPNLLWPKEESADPLNMVTDTAMQRRIAEHLIEQCHWMFPNLPEPTPPKSHTFPSPSHSSYSLPPPSPHSSESASFSSFTSSAGSSTGPTPVAAPKPRDRDQPHPLADHAQQEGVTVQFVDQLESSPSPTTPSPKVRRPPPVAPYKPTGTGSPHPGLNRLNSDDPPSPVPKPRHNTGSLPRGSSLVAPTVNGDTQATEQSLSRPTPPARTKRSGDPPPTMTKPAPPTASKPTPSPNKPSQSGRGPSRKAPPPPISKKPSMPMIPASDNQDDEVSAL